MYLCMMHSLFIIHHARLLSVFLCLHSPKERNLCLCSLSWIISGVCMMLWSLEGNFLYVCQYNWEIDINTWFAFSLWNGMCCKMILIFIYKWYLFIYFWNGIQCYFLLNLLLLLFFLLKIVFIYKIKIKAEIKKVKLTWKA